MKPHSELAQDSHIRGDQDLEIRHDKDFVYITNGLCEFAVDCNEGLWSGKACASERWFFQNARFSVDEEPGQRWVSARTVISWSPHAISSVFGKGIELRVTMTPKAGYAPVRMLCIRLYSGHSFVELGWGVKNRFGYPIRIRKATLLDEGMLLEGKAIRGAILLNSGAGADANLVVRGSEIEALNGVLLTYTSGGLRQSMVAGGLQYREYAREVSIHGPRRRGRQPATVRDQRKLSLRAWDPQGKWLSPGETYLSMDTSYLDFVTADPFQALEAYGSALRTANRAAPNLYNFPTLCGWMVSMPSLGEGAPINNSVGLVEQTRIARARGLMNYTPLAVRLEPDTYCYGNHGNTQQGWWDDAHWRALGPGNGHVQGESQGSLQKPYDSFVKFCKALADLGGIPFTYFQSSMPSNDFAAAHPDWMLNNDISLLHVTHPHHRPAVRYDFTDPGFRKHCRSVWRRLHRAGLQGVKFDYPETAWARDGGFEDRTFTTVSAYRELFQLCRDGLGAQAFLHERNLGGVTHESAPCLDVTAGIVDIQRVWGDASHFEAEMASRIGLRWYKSRTVFLYYPDGKSFYRNGRELPAYKRRAFLSLIAFLSGRLEIGTSIGSMTDEMFHDVTRLYPVFGGTRSPRPVDMLTGKKHPETYVYAVTPDWFQVLLVNNNKQRRKTISAPLSGDSAETGAIGADAGAAYHAFDFWQQRYLGRVNGTETLSASLRGGEVAMISLRKCTDQPQPLSTNRHIMQGMLECHDIQWSPRTGVLKGSVDLIGGETFVLTIACNRYVATTFKGAQACRQTDDPGIVELLFESPSNMQKKFQLRFASPGS